MSAGDDGDDGGPGRREVAHRVFAAEFDDATVSYRESDEERAPNYVVTPTGLRANRLFAAGVLTEVESVNDDVVRARVADPTGVFVSYAGQYQPDALAFLERTDPPAFVALTGKARTFEPDDGDRIYTSVRPESVNEVDADTRDRWVVGAAEATLERVAVVEEALAADVRGDDLREHLRARGHPEALAAGVPVAVERYGTTPAYLEAVRQTAVEALELVAGERDAVGGVDIAPDEGGTTEVGPTPSVGTDEAGGAAATDADAGPGMTAGEPTTESDSGSTADVDATADTEPATESADATADTEPATEGADPAEPTGTGTDDTAADATAGDDALGDFDAGTVDETTVDEDEMYELDEEERREVEEEFGTEFSTGSEVGEPGEAGIDVPGPDDVEADAGGGDDDGAAAADDGADADPVQPDPAAEDGADGDADDVDLEDAAVEAMEALDDGDGADRERVVAAVVDDHGVDPGAVEDAIQDALMSGRCYEPGEGALKPI